MYTKAYLTSILYRPDTLTYPRKFLPSGVEQSHLKPMKEPATLVHIGSVLQAKVSTSRMSNGKNDDITSASQVIGHVLQVFKIVIEIRHRKAPSAFEVSSGQRF
jgi:hypothetical protein